MAVQHAQLANGRWNEMSLIEQLGNIGSEVERALRWSEKGNHDLSMRAMERALELFNLTVACPANKHRLKEVTRAREVLLDFLMGDNEYNSTADSLRKYYLELGIAARLASGK